MKSASHCEGAEGSSASERSWIDHTHADPSDQVNIRVSRNRLLQVIRHELILDFIGTPMEGALTEYKASVIAQHLLECLEVEAIPPSR